MSSFFAQVMEPGGGVKLLPFVRFVITLLFILTVIGAIVGVARVHMIVLSCLSAGLLISLAFFESEYNKLRKSSSRLQGSSAPTSTNTPGKTD
ncbi:hypothetical protein ACA910_000185 [Epithemia clementina (nom. ined.)]